MNVKELELTKQDILAEPKLFNMHNWGFRTSCGTVACLAGHTLLRHGAQLDRFGDYVMGDEKVWTEREATALLGLTFDQADRLFYVDGWAEEYRNRYKGATLLETRAQITAEYIGYFIATESKV